MTLKCTERTLYPTRGEIDVEKAKRMLTVVNSLLREAFDVLEMLRQAVEIYCRLRQALWLQRWRDDHGQERNRDRRSKMREDWMRALPKICEEGEVL